MKINIIHTTTDSNKMARHIAESVVKEKLSPCVHIVPKIESIYNWNGKLENSNEFLLIIKTLPKHVFKCKKHILKLHNYDIPEIMVTEGEIALDTYSDWFLNNVAK